MKHNLKSIAAGFAAGLAVAAVAAQAGQSSQAQPHAQHQQAQPHAQHQQAQQGPHQGMQQGGMMMDPAMHQQMMERMRQCHETMSTMMRHMEEMGRRHGAPSQQP